MAGFSQGRGLSTIASNIIKAKNNETPEPMLDNPVQQKALKGLWRGALDRKAADEAEQQRRASVTPSDAINAYKPVNDALAGTFQDLQTVEEKADTFDNRPPASLGDNQVSDMLPMMDAASGFFKDPEQKEKDSALLEERNQFIPGYRKYREDFMDNGGNYNDMMSFNDWSQQQIDNGSWLATEGVDIAGGDQATNMNAFMNDPNNPEAVAYLESVGMEPGEWDFYNDYAMFAQDGSDLARNAWVSWYSDPNVAPIYYQQLGDIIDTDQNGEISAEEAGAYWDTMNEYAPETMDPFSDDEMMQRVYGYSDTGPSVYAMDAWNNYLARDQVLNSLIAGTYEDDVASGRINALTDSSGKDLVESLGLDRTAEEYRDLLALTEQPGYELSDEEMERLSALEEELYEKGTRYNNTVGAAQWADANTENPGQYNIDWGYYHGTPDMLAQLGAAAGYEDGEIDQMLRDYNQARGWTERYNNIAGGNAGITFRRPQGNDNFSEEQGDYFRAVSDITGAEYNEPAYYDENARTIYSDQITGGGDNSLIDLAGSPAISSDLAYLTAQDIGLTDRGWNVYGGGIQMPEYHQAAREPRQSESLLLDQDSPQEIRDRMYTEEQIANAAPGNQQNSMIRRNEYLERLAQKAENRDAYYANLEQTPSPGEQMNMLAQVHGGINYEESARAGLGVTVYNDGTVIDASGTNTSYIHRNDNPRNWNVGA